MRALSQGLRVGVRWWLLGASAVVMVAYGLSVTASSGHAQATTGQSTGQITSAVTSSAGGNLRIVVPAEPRSFNFDLDNNVSSSAIAALVVDNLVARNPRNYRANFTGLITAWKQKTPLKWEFKVRQGVKFSNGEPFDASVAAWAFTHEIQAKNSTTGAYISAVSSAVAPNKTQMVVTTTKPVPFLPQVMTLIQALPRQYFLSVGDTQFGRAPIGTGQFLLKSWTPGQSITLVPNSRYWGEKAQLESTTFNFATQDTTRINLLATGAADIATNLPVATAASSGYTVQKVPTSFVMKLGLNLHEAPFNDVRLRRAVAMAINRRQLVGSIFGVDGALLYQNLLQPVFPSAGHHGKEYIAYNPDGAKALLKQVGDVPPIDFYWTNGRYVLDNLVGQAIAGMLKDVGFTVNEHPMESGAFFTLLLTDKMPGMHMYGNSLAFFAEPGTFLAGYVSGSVVNYCVDGSSDAAFNQAVVLPYGAKRNALYNQAEETLLTKTICPVPLYIQKVAFGVSTSVHEFIGDYTGSWTSLGNVTVKP